jgi:hypothetical protein
LVNAGSTGLTTSLQRTVSALTAQINSVRQLLLFILFTTSGFLHSCMTEMLTLRGNFWNHYQLEDRTQELESTRKRSNHDVPFGVQDVHKAITPKYDASTLREKKMLV